MTIREILSFLSTDLRLAGMSKSTCAAYVSCVRKYMEYIGKPLVQSERSDLARFVRHLGEERLLSPSSVKCYVCALLFAYRVTLKRPEMVEGLKSPRVTAPLVVVLSPDEVSRLLGSFTSPTYRALAKLLYGTGMRLSEGLGVRVEDIDASRGVIRASAAVSGQDAWASSGGVCGSTRLPACGSERGSEQGCNAARAAAQLRHASARGRCGHPHGSASSGARVAVDDGEVPAPEHVPSGGSAGTALAAAGPDRLTGSGPPCS